MRGNLFTRSIVNLWNFIPPRVVDAQSRAKSIDSWTLKKLRDVGIRRESKLKCKVEHELKCQSRL